jgi:hypothetical protein
MQLLLKLLALGRDSLYVPEDSIRFKFMAARASNPRNVLAVHGYMTPKSTDDMLMTCHLTNYPCYDRITQSRLD